MSVFEKCQLCRKDGAKIIRNYDRKEICGRCLIEGPDFDHDGLIKEGKKK